MCGRDSKVMWLHGSDTYWSVCKAAFAPGAATAERWILACSLTGTHLFSLLNFIVWVSLRAISAQSSDGLVIMEDRALRIIVMANATSFSDCLKYRHGLKHTQRLLWDTGSIHNDVSFQQVNSSNQNHIKQGCLLPPQETGNCQEQRRIPWSLQTPTSCCRRLKELNHPEPPHNHPDYPPKGPVLK